MEGGKKWRKTVEQSAVLLIVLPAIDRSQLADKRYSSTSPLIIFMDGVAGREWGGVLLKLGGQWPRGDMEQPRRR